jgi:hypothetical protein
VTNSDTVSEHHTLGNIRMTRKTVPFAAHGCHRATIGQRGSDHPSEPHSLLDQAKVAVTLMAQLAVEVRMARRRYAPGDILMAYLARIRYGPNHANNAADEHKAHQQREKTCRYVLLARHQVSQTPTVSASSHIL